MNTNKTRKRGGSQPGLGPSLSLPHLFLLPVPLQEQAPGLGPGAPTMLSRKNATQPEHDCLILMTHIGSGHPLMTQQLRCRGSKQSTPLLGTSPPHLHNGFQSSGQGQNSSLTSPSTSPHPTHGAVLWPLPPNLITSSTSPPHRMEAPGAPLMGQRTQAASYQALSLHSSITKPAWHPYALHAAPSWPPPASQVRTALPHLEPRTSLPTGSSLASRLVSCHHLHRMSLARHSTPRRSIKQMSGKTREENKKKQK